MKFTIITCVVLLVMQSIYMFIPSSAVNLYNMAFRPLVYTVLTLMVYVFIGQDKRPLRKAYNANMVAILSVLMFGLVFLITSFMFGAGINAMAEEPLVVANNLWQLGSIIVLGELIRFKLIKSAKPNNRYLSVFLLTITLAYGHMNAIRVLINTDIAVWAIFYESIFKAIVISSLASFFSIRGSYASVLLVSFVYTKTPYLVPIMPNVSPLAWVLITCGLVFITFIIYHFIMNDSSFIIRQREKRTARYAKKPILANIITAIVIGTAIAFFMGVFPMYPVVVLTESMAGTFERGSIVIIERVPEGEAFVQVGEGEVIHFTARTGLEYIHRVIDFVHDIDGERQYMTRGDASEITDPFPVAQDDVLGIARATLPFLGYPYIFFQALINSLN